MSNEQKHASKDSLEAMKANDEHSLGKPHPVPDGAHGHSPAAHEGEVKAHTKAAGDQRELVDKEESQRQAGRATETYRNS